MPSFKQIKILPFKSLDLFNLVLDIKSYPEFLPWCAAAKIIDKNDNEIIAELVLQVKSFSYKYQSRITYQLLENKNYLIDVEAISGPFKYLKNNWQFISNDQSTQLKFNIDFKMQSIILEKLIGAYFTKAAKEMITAFEERAKSLFNT